MNQEWMKKLNLSIIHLVMLLIKNLIKIIQEKEL